MFYILWEFKVALKHRSEFEEAYKGDGVWARLFGRDPAYVKTILLRNKEDETRYVTIDAWKDRQAHADFKNMFAVDYSRIDKECELLTQSERVIGIYEEIV